MLALFKSSGKLKKSKMVDPRCPPFKNMTQFLCHMTSPAMLQTSRFGHTIFPLSVRFVVITFNILGVKEGGGGQFLPDFLPPANLPGLNRVNLATTLLAALWITGVCD